MKSSILDRLTPKLLLIFGLITVFILGVNIASKLSLIAQTSQTYNLHVQWDPSPITDLVASYNLTVDNDVTTVVPNTTDTTCSCINVPYTFAVGIHTVTVTAITGFGVPSDPTVYTFNLTKAGQIKNVRVRK